MPPDAQVEVVRGRERAEVLMQPLRLRILAAARRPGSAAELARRLDLTPQKVNYHVKRLAGHGFLRRVEERRAGNVVETVYAATADRYVLASSLLGDLGPDAEESPGGTAAHWLSVQARAETELAAVMEAGSAPDTSTLVLDTELRFESAEQRALFARAVKELFGALVSKYTSPYEAPDGGPAAGRPYRLLLGCYPVPGPGAEPPASPSGDAADADAEGDG